MEILQREAEKERRDKVIDRMVNGSKRTPLESDIDVDIGMDSDLDLLLGEADDDHFLQAYRQQRLIDMARQSQRKNFGSVELVNSLCLTFFLKLAVLLINLD